MVFLQFYVEQLLSQTQLRHGCFIFASISRVTANRVSNTHRVANTGAVTSQKDNGMQYYVMNQNLNNEKDIDNRKFHRHCVHPSREQLSFDELGKVYANISRRRIVSKVCYL